MKFMGYLLAACLIIAALRLVLVVLIVALAIGFLSWSIRRPRDVLGFLAIFTAFTVINTYPAVVLGLVVVGFLIWAWKGSDR
jgi:hypothetical protein